MNRTVKVLLVLNLLVLSAIFARSFVVEQFAAAQSSASVQAKDNQELARLMDEDQADRMPPAGRSIDWKVVAARDEARLKRVKELYSQNQLHTGNDYFNAALVLQHSNAPEDYLLAHELCVVAISKKRGIESLAAASEDRFLMSLAFAQNTGGSYEAISNSHLHIHFVDAPVFELRPKAATG